jgi:secreted trypsin-like serine protease
MNGRILVLLLGLASLASAKYVEIKPKVVNGTDTDIAEFPFMVSLRRNNRHSCGGSIINEWWVLTVSIEI